MIDFNIYMLIILYDKPISNFMSDKIKIGQILCTYLVNDDVFANFCIPLLCNLTLSSLKLFTPHNFYHSMYH